VQQAEERGVSLSVADQFVVQDIVQERDVCLHPLFLLSLCVAVEGEAISPQHHLG
jgi:hypothetical protein